MSFTAGLMRALAVLALVALWVLLMRAAIYLMPAQYDGPHPDPESEVCLICGRPLATVTFDCPCMSPAQAGEQ